MRLSIDSAIYSNANLEYSQGKLLHLPKDRSQGVTTLIQNTDYVLRSGASNHTPNKPSSDAEAQSFVLKQYNPLVSLGIGRRHALPPALVPFTDDFGWDIWVVAEKWLASHRGQVAYVAVSLSGGKSAGAGWDNSGQLWDEQMRCDCASVCVQRDIEDVGSR